jgi:hypothetical protein
MSRSTDVKDFARRVERLCDFFIGNAKKDDSTDLKVIHDLKDDAADIQTVGLNKAEIVSETLDGLSDYMKGANLP